MKQNRGPVLLTVNGKAEIVIQNAQSYQEMVTRLDRAESIAAIRRGINDFENGNAQETREAFDEIRHKHGIPS